MEYISITSLFLPVAKEGFFTWLEVEESREKEAGRAVWLSPQQSSIPG
jgi:hypothetical protein